CYGHRPQLDQRFLLPIAQGRVLRFSQYQANRMAIEETGRRAARRRWRRRAVWYRLRRFWRRLFTLQRGQLDREHRESARSRRRLGKEKSVKPETSDEAVPVLHDLIR